MKVAVHFSVIELDSHSVVCILVDSPHEACQVEAEVFPISTPRCRARLEWLMNPRLPGCLTSSFKIVAVELSKMAISTFSIAVCVASPIVIFDPVVFPVRGWPEERIKTIGRACTLRLAVAIHQGVSSGVALSRLVDHGRMEIAASALPRSSSAHLLSKSRG